MSEILIEQTELSEKIAKGDRIQVIGYNPQSTSTESPIGKKFILKVWSPELCDKNELIIMGMGHTRVSCPFDAETWAVNTGYSQIITLGGHVEKVFFAHAQVPHPIGGGDIFRWEEVNFLDKCGVEMINIHRIKGVNFKQFPLKRITKKFSTDYFGNTICYMIAYALDRATEIDKTTSELKLTHPLKLRLYGVDMHTKEEYQWEKGGIEFWLGYLLGLGGEVAISEGSTVLQNPTGKPYGIKYFKYKDIDPEGLRFKKKKKNAVAPAGALPIRHFKEIEEHRYDT